MFACTEDNGKILMARNCHKAVYHGTLLNRCKVTYVYPEVLKEGINGDIKVKDVEDAIKDDPDIKAVLITSPTYDGVLSDVKGIAKVWHDNGGILIVDSAHGAHYGFNDVFKDDAAIREADLCVVSLHKTLPSVTQSALLLRNGERVKDETVRFYLNIYETSSPSYLMMAAMEKCLTYMEENDINKNLWMEYQKELSQFYNNVRGLRVLSVYEHINDNIYDKDVSKILIFTKGDYTGYHLIKELRETYHIECEMAAVNYVIALSSVMDTAAGFNRLAMALRQIDNRLSKDMKDMGDSFISHRVIYSKKEKAYDIYEAEEMDYEIVNLSESEGRISKEMMYLYPPGIPILVKGEIIPPSFVDTIRRLESAGFVIEGVENHSLDTIKVLK